jgi:hypothetical protein
MSASYCLKCGDMVGGYEKYCDSCIEKYGVRQTPNFWKNAGEYEWNNRETIFQEDLAQKPGAGYTGEVKPKNIASRVTVKSPVYMPRYYPLSAKQRAYKRPGTRAAK